MERSELLPRFITGSVLVSATVIFVILNRIFLLVILEIAIFFGTLEFLRMLTRSGSSFSTILAVAGGMCIALGFYFGNPLPVLTLVLLVVLSFQLIVRTDEFRSAAGAILGIFYPALLLSHIIPLRRMGVGHALMPLIYVWVFDTMAYLVGKKWGKRKITPRISPGKSLEGTLAGLLFSVLAGLVAKFAFAHFLSLTHAVLLGIVVPLCGQLGDLYESLVKRSAELKDSSTMLPGHGGVLDRLDSLMFAVPAAYYYFLYVVR